MKVAELSTRYPPATGGVERHVREVATRLVARGDDVAVLTTELEREFPWRPLPPAVPRREVVDGVRIRRLPAFSLPGELHYPFVRGLGRALEEERPELLHVHTYGTNHAAAARRYFRRHGTPFVMTAHFHPIWSMEGGWARRRVRSFYDRVLAAPVMGAARAVVVQSHEEERLLRTLRIRLPPVEIIPPGYTPLPAPPSGTSFAEAWRIPGPFLLFVGRLAANKGLAPLVEAFGQLAEHDRSATLVLVGADGGQRAAVEELARRRGVAERMRVTGFIEDDAMLAAAFREARLAVLPSEYEAFGLVLLEAMAQGTPVIASRVGGIPEFVEDGKAGRLVPPGDAGALATALLRLWDDGTARSAMGEYGKREIVPRYSWEAVVDRLRALFARTVAG